MPQELMRYRYKRIFLLAALLWMAVIFSFSARPADDFPPGLRTNPPG